jgi:hypothetical protein
MAPKKAAKKTRTAKKKPVKPRAKKADTTTGYFMMAPAKEEVLDDIINTISNCVYHFKPRIKLQLYKPTMNIMMIGIDQVAKYDKDALMTAFSEFPITVYDFVSEQKMAAVARDNEEQLLEGFELQPLFNTIWLAMQNLYHKKGWHNQPQAMTQWDASTNDIMIYNVSDRVHGDLLEALKEAGFTGNDYTVEQEKTGWCFTLKKEALKNNTLAAATLLENSEAM